MEKYSYPKAPENVPIDLVKVSKQYKSQVVNVLLAITLFIFSYVLILILSLLMVYYGVIAAGYVIALRAHWITIGLGAGIVVTVVMIFVFLVKFLFKVKKDESPSRIELTRDEYPVLFEFIGQVCSETKARFPKKIFVSPDVNACVFYNSSFLSMFFPASKNLEIGLGLINSVNMTEFKAILGHEFGHFSQSSTKLGSYIYRLNKMIHDLLYDNEGWSEALNSIGRIHGILSIFSSLTIVLVNGILKVFVGLYHVINKAYLALSREMEFHADLVAVSVTGSEPIVSALYRLEFGQEVYNYTLDGVKMFYDENKALPENFFELQSRNMLYLTNENGLSERNKLPVIDTNTVDKINSPDRIQIKDLWASHPSIREREKNAKLVFIKNDYIDNSPWSLFGNTEKLQEQMTKKIYELQLGIPKPEIKDIQSFVQFFEQRESKEKYNPIYCRLYQFAGNTMAIPVTDNEIYVREISTLNLTDLFNDEILNRSRRIFKTQQATEFIKEINDGKIKVENFEFDGKVYSIKDSSSVYGQLKRETEAEEKWLEQHKIKIATWFYYKMKERNSVEAEAYSTVMKTRIKMGKDRGPFLNVYTSLINFYNSIARGERNNDDPKALYAQLKSFYNSYIDKKANVNDETMPQFLQAKGLFSEGYKAALLNVEVRNPFSKGKSGLDGLNPLMEDMQKLIEGMIALDDSLFRVAIELQDKAIGK